MPDSEATNAVTAPPVGEEQAHEFTPITSQEQLDKLIGSRLAREKAKYADYEQLKSKAAQFDKLEEANKTELEKTQERLTAETKARTIAETTLLRYQVATENGLDAKAADFLHGDTREELEASAAALMELVGVQSKQPLQPNPLQGRENKPAASTGGDWLRNAIAAGNQK